MAEINFYQLTKTPLEKTVAKLLEKVMEADSRAVVLCQTPARLESLDSILWTYSTLSFLPHGTIKDGSPEDHPIWLTTTFENPNKARFLFVVEGTCLSDLGSFERCLDIFNGLDQTSIEAARHRWRTYKSQNHTLTYWMQDESGSWLKKT